MSSVLGLIFIICVSVTFCCGEGFSVGPRNQGGNCYRMRGKWASGGFVSRLIDAAGGSVSGLTSTPLQAGERDLRQEPQQRCGRSSRTAGVPDHRWTSAAAVSTMCLPHFCKH